MKKLLIPFMSVVICFTSCSQGISNKKSLDKTIQIFMEGRKEHDPEKILKFFGKKDSTNISVSSFCLNKNEKCKISKIEQIKINAASVSKGDVAYTIRISDDNFKTYQDFWHLLRSVNGEWICVEHYAVGIEDDYEFYER